MLFYIHFVMHSAGTRARKRKCSKSLWKKSQRKVQRQRGEEYVNSRGHVVPKRNQNYAKDCTQKCRFKCREKVTQEQSESLFTEFWQMSDNQKGHFYDKTTLRCVKKRTRPENANSVRPRSYSYAYYFVVNDKKKYEYVKHFICKL